MVERLAACRAAGCDPDDWFPEPGDQATAARAKSVCAQCPVRAECLAAALARNEQHGIYGGLTDHERRELPRRRACRRCGGPAATRRAYCGDECAHAARLSRQASYDRRRVRAGQRRRTDQDRYQLRLAAGGAA